MTVTERHMSTMDHSYPIIILHGIGTPQRTLEPGEDVFWLSQLQFNTVLDTIVEMGPAAPHITFDDGNLSDHDIAMPLLLERGLRADFFVLSRRIDTPGSLGEGHIRALQSAGMTIGSHGVAHQDWRRLDATALHAELTESRAALEAICGHAITTAGIPFGGYDARVLRALRHAGYTTAYSSDRGTMNPHAFLRPRTSIKGAMQSSDVAAILAGQMPILQQLSRMIGMGSKRINRPWKQLRL